MSEGDIQVLKNELEHIKGQIRELKEEITNLRNRLPLWAYAIGTGMFGIITALLAWFGKG